MLMEDMSIVVQMIEIKNATYKVIDNNDMF